MSARPEVYEAPQYGPALTALVEALEFCLYGRPVYPLNLSGMESGLIYLSGFCCELPETLWKDAGVYVVRASDDTAIVHADAKNLLGLLWIEQAREEGLPPYKKLETPEQFEHYGCPMRRAERGERG